MTEPKNVTLERGWAMVLKDVGLSPADVLRRAQLPEDTLHRENVKLSVSEYLGLWNTLAELEPDPNLAIRFGQAASPETFQPPLFAALCSSCLQVALERIGKYKRLIAPMSLLLSEEEQGLGVSWRWHQPHVVSPPLLMAVEVVFVTQLARIGTREQVVPVEVVFPEPLEITPEIEAFFGRRPVRGPEQRVVFHPNDAKRPFMTASESIWKTFEPELRRRLSKLEGEMPASAQVRSVLLECLPGGEASLDDVARRLGKSRRSLQRQLKLEGVVYRQLVKEVRQRLIRHYLENTTLAYGEIAYLVGFDETSSFFRAVKDWTGTTPEAIRRAG